MPPREGSRYLFAQAYTDHTGCLVLTEPEPFGYVELPDNIAHQVTAGETLQTLAGRYFKPMRRPAGLWWIIADFQPTPIVDPTIALAGGSIVIIPSLRTVQTKIMNQNRRNGTL